MNDKVNSGVTLRTAAMAVGLGIFLGMIITVIIVVSGG